MRPWALSPRMRTAWECRCPFSCGFKYGRSLGDSDAFAVYFYLHICHDRTSLNRLDPARRIAPYGVAGQFLKILVAGQNIAVLADLFALKGVSEMMGYITHKKHALYLPTRFENGLTENAFSYIMSEKNGHAVRRRDRYAE